MFELRLYLAALTLVLFLACVCTGHVGAQGFVVVACPLLYMILDMHEELQGLEGLESQLSAK